MPSNYHYPPNSEPSKMMTEEDYFEGENQRHYRAPPIPFDWSDRGPAYRERQAALKALQSLPSSAPDDFSGASAPSGTRENPTVLNPRRTSAFSRNDAQTLSALDPTGALLKRADAMASDERFKPNLVTGRNEATGKSFTMQPTNSINSKTLGIMGAQFMQEKLQAQQDAELAGTRKHQTDMISLPLASNERVTNSRIAGDKDMAGLEIAGRKTEADATRAYNLPGQTLQNEGLATVNAAGKLALAKAQQGVPELQEFLAKHGPELSKTPEGRAAITTALASIMKGSGVDPTIAGNLSTATQVSTPEHTAAILDSPFMKPQVASVVAFAKQLSNNSFLGNNTQQPADIADFKKSIADFIQTAKAQGADEKTAMSMIASMINAEVPRELQSSKAMKIMGEIMKFSIPYVNIGHVLTRGNPVSASTAVRTASGL